jgi:hypothetical protein
MARLKQNKNIDDMIQSISFIAENQCSLSEQDSRVLSEMIDRLQSLKRKKGKTNKQIQEEFSRIVKLLLTFLEVEYLII